VLWRCEAVVGLLVLIIKHGLLRSIAGSFLGDKHWARWCTAATSLLPVSHCLTGTVKLTFKGLNAHGEFLY